MAGFTQVQAPAVVTTSTTTLSLTMAATAAHNVLVVCIECTSLAQSTPPAGQGWRLAEFHTTADGRVEQWYIADCAAGITTCTWTLAAAGGSGGISEHTPPAGTAGVYVDAVARATGTNGLAMTGINANCANQPGDLGVCVIGDFFTAAPTASGWTYPSGYTVLCQQRTVAKCFSSSAIQSAPAGTANLTASLNVTVGDDTSWCAVVVYYRAVRWSWARYEGAEPCSAMAISPDGRQMVVGGDVWGAFRYFPAAHQSQPSSTGVQGTKGNQSFVGLMWSPFAGQPTTVFAATGKSASEQGSFMRSDDGGVTWTVQSTSRDWRNIQGSPPGAGAAADRDRPIYRLLAADPGNTLIYTVDTAAGVFRSSNYGVTWTNIGTPGLYLRAILINPANLSEAWVAGWDATATASYPGAGSSNGGVWHTTNLLTGGTPTAAGSVTWSRLAGFTGTAADLQVVGTGASMYLYVAGDNDGIYRSAMGTGTLTSLNGSGSTYGGASMNTIDTGGSSQWVAVDGYVDGSGNHVVYFGCSGGKKVGADANFTVIVKLTITPGGAVTYTDMTGPHTINTATLPDGRAWWHYNWSWQFWLGGNDSCSPRILIDPTDPAHQTIYVVNSGGFFRSDDGGTTWYIDVAGMNSFNVGKVAHCPIDTEHMITCGSDFPALEMKLPGGVAGAISGANPAAVTATQLPHDTGTTAESHGVAFDPVTGDIAQVTNAGYSQNTHGRVSYRFHSDPATTWHDCGYQAAVIPNNGPMGIFTGRLSDGTTRYMVVPVQFGGGAGGMYRALSTNGGVTWSWTGTGKGLVNPDIGSSGEVAQTVPIVVSPNDASRLWAFDRKRGLYRSADRGATWTRAWNTTLPLGGAVTDGMSGWMAFNPDTAGELWVSASDGLWRLSNVGSTTATVENGQITAVKFTGHFGGGAGGVAFYNHVLYVASLANGAGQPTPQLWACANPSAAAPSFSDVGGPEFGAYCPRPHDLQISAAGMAVCTGTEDTYVWSSLATASPAPTITVAPASLPGGERTVAYSQTFTASGGTGPYTFAVTAGALPTGLALAGAVLSGTPTADGTYTFTITATDTNSYTGAASYTVAVSTVAITTASLPSGSVGAAYTASMASAGGVVPYAYSVTAGSLPTGISMSAAGAFTGTPTVAGVYPFTVQVTDFASVTATAALSITITAAAALTVTTSSLRSAVAGEAYTAALGATGGTSPYTWAVTGGALPPGITLSGATLSGTPLASTPGSTLYPFTITVTDHLGATASAALSITVYTTIPAPVIKGPWRFLYCNPQPDGSPQGEIVQATQRTLTLRTEVGQNHETTVILDGRSLPANAIGEDQTDIQVLFGGQVIFCGRVSPTQDDLDAAQHQTTISALDYREVLRRRYLLSTDPPSGSGSNLSWTSIEQAKIAWEMITSAQARTNGNLGIARGVGQNTGTQRTYTATAGDYVSDDIDTIAQMTTGFEWDITPYHQADLRLDVFYPWRGSDQGVVLEYGDKRIASISRVVDPTQFANAVFVTGNSSKSLTPHIQDASDMATRPEGRWETVIGTSLNTQSSLDQFGSAQLAQLQVLTPAYTIIFYPGAWDGPGFLWLGDYVTVRIASGRLNVNDRLRVMEMSFDVDPNNIETLTATIGVIPLRLRKTISQIRRSLRYLNTR